jgi:uncharacterized protein YrzB (UPF0473 family)
MSGKKISEMTAMTGAQLDQTNDVLPVLDVSDTTNPNKKISIEELASILNSSLNTTNTSLGVSTSTNVLTLTDSDGNDVTVDLSHLDDSGTDTNTTNTSAVIDGSTNVLTITDSESNTITVDLSQLDDPGTDTNTTNTSLGVSTSTNVLTLIDSDGNDVTVDLSHLQNVTEEKGTFSGTSNSLANLTFSHTLGYNPTHIILTCDNNSTAGVASTTSTQITITTNARNTAISGYYTIS